MQHLQLACMTVLNVQLSSFRCWLHCIYVSLSLICLLPVLLSVWSPLSSIQHWGEWTKAKDEKGASLWGLIQLDNCWKTVSRVSRPLKVDTNSGNLCDLGECHLVKSHSRDRDPPLLISLTRGCVFVRVCVCLRKRDRERQINSPDS